MGQIPLGELAAAEGNLRRSIRLSCETQKKDLYRAIGDNYLGRLLSYQGFFDDAECKLNEAIRTFDRIPERGWVCSACIAHALYTSLMGDAKAALASAQRALEMACGLAGEWFPHEQHTIRAKWLLGAALVTLAAQERDRQDALLEEAELHLNEAFTRCRRINMVDHEPDILLALARWHHAKGNSQRAHMDAQEALAIADRCEYRLKQAEIHNFLAHLSLEAGDRESARQHAEIAQERAWCDGPPHCYKPALEEAERLMREIEQHARSSHRNHE
jgi:tetratricopeptide (TPR) repeat protein